jgi:predicted transcriptional regulator
VIQSKFCELLKVYKEQDVSINLMQTAKIKKNSETDLKLKALSKDIRRLLLGLIFTNGPIYHSEILKHIQMDSNRLAYHLNMLYKAHLIDRVYERQGKKYSKYWIKKDGEKFLDFIGAKGELNKI